MTGIKICGINDPDAFDHAVACTVDFLGFNFFPPSPRAVSPVAAAGLSARHTGGPKRVGLFVDPTDDEITDTLARIELDALQLYVGQDRAAAVRRHFAIPVWRAVGIASPADLPTEAAGIDALVIESQPPPGADRPGGNATSLDWSILAGWRPPVPWLLAGGLTAANVATAIRASAAPAVDVSSGVERARGVKDPELIRAFVQAARQSCVKPHSARGSTRPG